MDESLDAMTNKFSTVDYIVFILMLVCSSGIGIFYAFKGRKNESSKEFLTANKSLNWFPVSMSLLASFQSSVTILGYPAEMYTKGTQFWVVILSAIFASITAAELFLPVYFKLSFTSVNRYLTMRFNRDNVRLAASMAFLLGTVPYMGVVLYGPSLALSSVTPLSVTSSILIIGIICTFYTSLGGIKAVVWTDTMQVGLMYIGLVAVMLRAFYLVGGVGEAFRIAAERGRIEFTNFELDVSKTNNFWNSVLGMGIMWCGNYCTTQTEVQRYCNTQSQKKAKLALYVNLVGVILMISCACLCGIGVFAYYADCDPLKAGKISKTDQLMPYFVMDTMSEFKGLPGIFVTCVFSASLSTLSSGFNALSAVTWDDFLKETRLGCLSEQNQKNFNKITAIFYGILSILMAFIVGQIGSVLKAAISLAGCLIGPLLGIYLSAILCPFANSKGVISGLTFGVSFGFWVLIGSLVYPANDDFKETLITGCPANFISNSTLIVDDVLENQPFFLKLYQIAFLLVPVTGFIICLFVSFVASLLTGGLNDVKHVDPNTLSPLVWKIWPERLLPPKSDSSKDKEVIEISVRGMNSENLIT
ncbi:sodium-coupled monocarboxylate transporter 2 [Tetranychus urticae]|uniref:Sodium/solute symporter n=1 Tax=Tetranychus urticae TaxID=32264 RepID=T1KE24_TETUR|nr:sodium-coupled monocarboxylate transporter 2 [Tetranychus urticae]